MGYQPEGFAATLKAARDKKGLSQRALSALAGVPQPHISKIEKGQVNLTVASLVAIANALDLGIALVPRRAMPAVKAITRNLGEERKASPDVRREIARVSKQLDHIKTLNIDASKVDEVERAFRGLRQFERLIRDKAHIVRIRKTLQATEHTGTANALRQAAQQMNSLRNVLAHEGAEAGRTRQPRPAYRLEDDNDD